MSIETKLLNSNKEVDLLSVNEDNLDRELMIVDFYIKRNDFVDWCNSYPCIQNFLENEVYSFSYLNEEHIQLIESIKVAVSARFKEDSGLIKPVFINSIQKSGGAYSVEIKIRCSQQLDIDGEFSIYLTNKDILSESQELSNELMNKILDVKSESELLVKDIHQVKQIEQLIEAEGVVSFYKKNVLDVLLTNELDSKLEYSSNDYDTLEKLNVFILKNYKVSSDMFVGFLDILANKNISNLNYLEFYEDFITNNENIFWNPETQNNSLFKLFYNKKTVELLIERYKKSINNSKREENSKAIYNYVYNNSALDISILKNVEEIFEVDYVGNIFSEEMTDLMAQVNQEESFKYDNNGFVLLTNDVLDVFIKKVIMDNSIAKTEQFIEWLYKKCNKDLKSHKFGCFSLKEESDTLLMSLIDEENCPSMLLTGYFLMGGLISKKILLSPRMDTDSELVNSIFIYLKKQLDSQMDNEELLEMYNDMMKNPNISSKIKESLNDSLIFYINNLKNTKDSSLLELEWDKVMNYQENNIDWNHGFSISGKRTEVLTIIAKNENAPSEIVEKYRLIFGNDSSEYQEIINNKIIKAENLVEIKNIFSNLNLEGKINLIIKRINSSTLNEKSEDLFLRNLYKSAILSEINHVIEDDKDLNSFSRVSKLLVNENVISHFPDVIEEAKVELSIPVSNYLLKRANDSKNPVELDMIFSLVSDKAIESRNSFVFIGVDLSNQKEIAENVLNNKNYRVNDFSNWLINKEEELKSLDKFELMLSREIEYLKLEKCSINERDFSKSAKNIRALFSLNSNQVVNIQEEMNSLKNKIKNIIIEKYKSEIENSKDEQDLENKIKYLFNFNSMNSLILTEKDTLELFPSIVVNKKDLEPIVESFLRNRFSPLTLKMNLRSSFWGEQKNANMAYSR